MIVFTQELKNDAGLGQTTVIHWISSVYMPVCYQEHFHVSAESYLINDHIFVVADTSTVPGYNLLYEPNYRHLDTYVLKIHCGSQSTV